MWNRRWLPEETKKKIKFRPSILRFRIPHSAFRMMLVRWKRNNESVSIRIDLMELFNWQNQRWKWKSSAFRIPDRRDRKRFEISNELHHFDLIPTDKKKWIQLQFSGIPEFRIPDSALDVQSANWNETTSKWLHPAEYGQRSTPTYHVKHSGIPEFRMDSGGLSSTTLRHLRNWTSTGSVKASIINQQRRFNRNGGGGGLHPGCDPAGINTCKAIEIDQHA